MDIKFSKKIYAWQKDYKNMNSGYGIMMELCMILINFFILYVSKFFL